MIIFVVNCGSSSVKYQLIDMKKEKVLAKGAVERIGMASATLTHKPANGEEVVLEQAIRDHKEALKLVIDALTNAESGVIKNVSLIDAVGHRVVHGGEFFTDSVLINPTVIHNIEYCCDLAPLHNPNNLLGIEACMEIMPDIPHVAVFDTAFHQTMPPSAYLYGIPYEYYKKYGIRRYGFHGTSHKYVAQKAAELMNEHLTDLRVITCHLGNGASVTAIKYGRSIATSMGFTPLEGLVMGTRCGEIDPTVMSFIMRKENLTIDQVEEILNKKSGILGISGLSSDFRDVEEAAEDGHQRSNLAIDIFTRTVRRYIGSYVADMGGVDAIVFTAGLGENAPEIREKICEGLEYLGTRIDPERNKCRGVEAEISAPRSRVQIFVIPTNEEIVIARDTVKMTRNIIK